MWITCLIIICANSARIMWKSLAHVSCYTCHFRDKKAYKPPDTTLFVKSVEMKFKVSREIWRSKNYVWWADREIWNLLPLWWWSCLCISQRQGLEVHLVTGWLFWWCEMTGHTLDLKWSHEMVYGVLDHFKSLSARGLVICRDRVIKTTTKLTICSLIKLKLNY